MHIKSIVAGAAIAMAATVGAASADDQFATLDGIAAQPLTAMQLDAVRAEGSTITLDPPVISFSFTFPNPPPINVALRCAASPLSCGNHPTINISAGP